MPKPFWPITLFDFIKQLSPILTLFPITTPGNISQFFPIVTLDPIKTFLYIFVFLPIFGFIILIFFLFIFLINSKKNNVGFCDLILVILFLILKFFFASIRMPCLKLLIFFIAESSKSWTKNIDLSFKFKMEEKIFWINLKLIFNFNLFSINFFLFFYNLI